MSDVTIKITKNGPLLISEEVKVLDQTTGELLEINPHERFNPANPQSLSKYYTKPSSVKPSYIGKIE